MRLLVDARFTRIGRHDGISRYGASLIAALSRHTDVVMLIHDERQLALLPDVPWVKVTSPLSPAELVIAGTINRLRPDVVFCPMQTMGSAGRRYGLILTLHDTIYYDHPTPPGFLPAPVRLLWRLYHRAYWPQRLLLNRADAVATVSTTTADAIARLRLTRRPVTVIGNAPQPSTASGPRDPGTPPERSLVYMGAFLPYKNVETLIAALGHLPGYTLHLLSRIAPARRRELAARVPPGGDVVFHDGVSDEEYTNLLHRCTALVTLSHAEGYGLPLVEAMAAGAPVIASDIPIFREVGADAIRYVPATDPAAVAAAVRELEDPRRWSAASVGGVARAADFDWDASARTLLALAEDVMAERARRPRRP
ncbi:mannosyltransferase [Tersicoccus phoenicis]|uniref:Mannosyltransferase n=1 Tax=Tersicoccus phoenicis TaxID=554083 RepID=A0A1R1LET1_9MICC|nr:glycosyltransferase family 1 protein [Tersicoccus phoenicis]OMH26050.1 mannosyltransferase [Tersicoccus phoenicis]